jgi:FxsC-like protein
MDDWFFFFSYAHADYDIYLKKFYEDLTKEVNGLTVRAKPSGFIDRANIGHGDQWNHTLEVGLRSCRVFVPIYSAPYFASSYCGKEFKVFRDRLHTHLQQQGEEVTDPLILPVLWKEESNVLDKIPASIDKIQYSHGTYPPEYLTEGLLQMVRLGMAPNNKYYDQYWDFVRKFANRIYSVGKTYQLQPAPSLSKLDKVEELFPVTTKPQPYALQGEGGPRYVQFIFVAGKQTELPAAQRSVLKFYGPQGGADWKPFLDAKAGSAVELAKEVISEAVEGLNYEEVTLSEGLIEQINEAAKQEKIVVVVVDTWTLRLPSYNQWIAPLDEYSSVNCLTLVLWNLEDDETDVNEKLLKTAVEGTFTTKISQNAPNFIPTIKCYDDFKTELSQALVRAQAAIVKKAEVKKKFKFALVQTPQLSI